MYVRNASICVILARKYCCSSWHVLFSVLFSFRGLLACVYVRLLSSGWCVNAFRISCVLLTTYMT